jgi:hypothetical protein
MADTQVVSAEACIAAAAFLRGFHFYSSVELISKYI